MPLDLSTTIGRQTATETLTRFRSETIPTDDRRTRAPSVDFTPTMRNAERPASQADAIRKVLGMAGELQTNLVDLKQTQFAEDEKANALIAAEDSATGNVNKDVYDRSLAYRMVIADGRVHKALATAAPAIAQDITSYVNQHADADPTKGEMPLTLDDVNARFDDHIKALLMDKDGKPIDYGDPHANATLYRAAAQLRGQVMQNAANAIKQQEQDKAMTSISTIATGDLMSGSTTAVEDAIHKAAALGITPDLAKKTMLHTVLNTAMQGKDESVIQKALTSLQSDGKTATWNPEERGVLLQNYSTLHNQFEAERKRDREEASSQNMGKMLPDIMSGNLRITPDAMRVAIAKGPANGGITAEHAEHLMSLQNSVDAKRQSEEANARSRASFAISMQDHAEVVAQRRAHEQFTSIQAGFFTGSMTQPQAIAGLDSMYKQGKLDDKTFVAARQFLMQVPSPSKLVQQHDAVQYERSLKEDLVAVDRWVVARKKGFDTPEQWTVRRGEAAAIFYRTLYSTGDPTAALTGAMQHINAPKPMIEQRVQSASRLTPKLTDFQRTQDRFQPVVP